ncbi:UNVERIFIED_CONTAM: hypothetical protein Sradi_3717100 [Sesamum radiatum]|uniref:F-box domain-containing protein n=1 Tax=Sesamum radiatum TaxID=300843 RepID=A0AAW2PXS9_SESRA
MSESCNILDHLPQAILLEIFCRLPIYDVTRCKVVCRAWLNLLSDPNFTNIYTSNTPFTTLLLEEMMSWSAIGTSSMKLSLLEVSATGEYTRTPLAPIGIPSDHLDYEHTSLVLVGSCNGFLCFSYHKYHSFGTSVVKEGLYINNPITREYIELPQYDEMLNTRDNIVRVKSHHFGFSPSTGEFKVVRIVYSVASIQPLTVDGKPEIRICTVGVDKEWRNLAWNPSNPLIMSNWSNVVTLNGVHHWIVVDKIHTFDIGKEQDGPILHLPVTVVGSSSKSSLSSMELLILNNQLTLVDNYVLSHITIWTMKSTGLWNLGQSMSYFRIQFQLRYVVRKSFQLQCYETGRCYF